jgi:7-cyano-7-deazaguanine synthase
MKKTVLLLSGGLDSAILLAHLRDEGREVCALSVNYGQRHFREIAAAEQLGKHYGVSLLFLNLPQLSLAFGPAPLLTGASDVESLPAEATVVPNRNMVLLSLAAAHALSSGAGEVALAAHLDDIGAYPDCRHDFLAVMNNAILLASACQVTLRTPLKYLSKGQVVKLGAKLGVPFGLTYSCYAGRGQHCGRCAACRGRKKGFAEAGVEDPTEYEEDVA